MENTENYARVPALWELMYSLLWENTCTKPQIGEKLLLMTYNEFFMYCKSMVKAKGRHFWK